MTDSRITDEDLIPVVRLLMGDLSRSCDGGERPPYEAIIKSGEVPSAYDYECGREFKLVQRVTIHKDGYAINVSMGVIIAAKIITPSKEEDDEASSNI